MNPDVSNVYVLTYSVTHTPRASHLKLSNTKKKTILAKSVQEAVKEVERFIANEQMLGKKNHNFFSCHPIHLDQMITVHTYRPKRVRKKQ